MHFAPDVRHLIGASALGRYQLTRSRNRPLIYLVHTTPSENPWPSPSVLPLKTSSSPYGIHLASITCRTTVIR